MQVCEVCKRESRCRMCSSICLSACQLVSGECVKVLLQAGSCSWKYRFMKQVTVSLSYPAAKCDDGGAGCRVFVALRERLDNTWINNYEYFVSAYSTASDSETLTREEVCHISALRSNAAAHCSTLLCSNIRSAAASHLRSTAANHAVSQHTVLQLGKGNHTVLQLVKGTTLCCSLTKGATQYCSLTKATTLCCSLTMGTTLCCSLTKASTLCCSC